MTTILLLGKNGLIGSALQQPLTARGIVQAHDRTTCDLARPDQIRAVIHAAKPDIIVNAAGYTAVDRAETEPALCEQINAVAPGIIAEEAHKLGALFVHYSSDYVFNGEKASAYLEDDSPAPLNAYGRSKLGGDRAVLQANGRNLILRVSWIYGSTGRNFATTILDLAKTREELTVVSDQFGTPTSANFIADVTARLIDASRGAEVGALDANGRKCFGVFNVAPAGRVSWHGYAIELVREALRQGFDLRVTEDRIIATSSLNRPQAAQRPKNSVLNTGKIQETFSLPMPDWKVDIRKIVSELSRKPQ